jgi:(2S)-methylsuccinyl-CoA dehydrogenase
MNDPTATDGIPRCAEALPAAERMVAGLLDALRARLAATGGGPGALQREQSAAHGVAWAATLTRALRELLGWAQRLAARGRLGELEALLLDAAFGEGLAQLAGGLAMSQGEIFRADALDERALAAFAADPAVAALRRDGFAPLRRARIVALVAASAAAHRCGDPGLDDADLEVMHAQFTRYADDHAEAAHRWHLADVLIPDAVLAELAELGVFGLTVPESHGGLGLGKTAMCVVTEALSRSHIGLGSLATRCEIAAELIARHGTPEQRSRYLPAIASGRIIPTACFTEPDAGSDLASLRTRAERQSDGSWKVYGNKTWITHGARSDLMTLLARTDREAEGYRGLSMFLAAKPRGSVADPFPAPGMSGGEIAVLGYRGMKEYEIAFDGFEMPADALLGGAEGRGFTQLMQTFESARIQTAARAVGVAQNALELGLAYALQRHQFGQPLVAFARVADKLAWMAVETMLARQLTLYAARAKDADRRCDIEAGMAKLLAARVAWSNADGALQIHGGNGYAQEYRISRVLCDARILSIFEGAAEIQAQVIARGLIDGR